MFRWHLGSFYKDSAALGGRLSSPLSHGFDHMNATVEVAPTATTNCECKEEWYEQCDFGHDGGPTHCGGKGNPGGGPPLKPGCCFNYWWGDDTAAHGVTNLTNASPDNDANDYLARALVDWIESRKGSPFMAQVSIHNCHIPFIGTPTERARCNSTESCLSPSGADTSTGRAGGAYTSAELDFYACLVRAGSCQLGGALSAPHGRAAPPRHASSLRRVWQREPSLACDRTSSTRRWAPSSQL
jgi:hypothetical protein